MYSSIPSFMKHSMREALGKALAPGDRTILTCPVGAASVPNNCPFRAFTDLLVSAALTLFRVGARAGSLQYEGIALPVVTLPTRCMAQLKID